MKSYWIRAIEGGTEVELRDVPIPEPTAGHLVARVRAAGLNRGEFMSRRDLHGHAGEARPAGTEFAGEVVAIGPQVTRFAVGDRVMATARGSFAEYILADAELAVPAPLPLSWDEAACTTLVFMVVHDMLVTHGRLQRGETVFVAGASSGVGVAAIQTAGALGARTIGTSGSAEKLERLRVLGLGLGIRTRGPDFGDTLLQTTDGKGVDLVINGIGGTVFAECIRALAYEGRLAMVGYVDGVLASTIDLSALHGKRLTVFGVSATQRGWPERVAAVRAFERDLLPLFAGGTLKPVVDRVFPFDQLPAAKHLMEANAHLGKIALHGTESP